MSSAVAGRTLQNGKYELRDAVAQGGMATVYTAHMRSLDTTVAVKVLSPKLSNNTIFRERFRAEANKLAQLHHANIIEVYDLDEDGDLMYIAMRFVARGTLKEQMKQVGGPMDLNLATKIVSQVASALQYAHDRGLVHQDVKPANILLGAADWPLLSDFGIAEWSRADGSGEGERKGSVMGTPAYMAPEQWEGAALDGRADQYALAIVFYELVTGRLPFEGGTIPELQTQHLTQQPPRPRELNAGIPGPVEEVLLRALAKPREHRFDRIEDFSAALAEAVERARGMQLETKQALVDVTPNLLGVLGLAVVTPLIVGLADARTSVVGSLTLNWPIALILALLAAGLLLGVRWHVVGLLSRLLNAIIDALDRLTRVYVRFGTDVGGPLQTERWRHAVVGSAEGIVGIAYVFGLYQMVGPPLIKTIALAWDPRQEPLVATVVTALVLLLAGANVLAIWRASGPVLATCMLALCWVFITGMPVIDRVGWGGLSIQWSAKLLIGVLVVLALFSVRRDVCDAARRLVVSLVEGPLARVRSDVSVDELVARRRTLERAADGLVAALFLIVSYAILALPFQRLFEPVIGPFWTSLVVTVLTVVATALLVNALRHVDPVVVPAIALILCSPMLLGLPLFDEYTGLGPWVRWIVRGAIGLIVLLLLLGIRGRIQSAARLLLVPAFERQVSAFAAPKTEAEATRRLLLLSRLSDGLVNLLYVLVAYVVVLAPLLSALGTINLGWLTGVVIAVFVAVSAWYLYAVGRDLTASSTAPSESPSAVPVAA